MDTAISLKIGHIFRERAKVASTDIERTFLTERMLAFFKCSILQMRDESKSSFVPIQKLFISHMANDDMSSMAEKAIRILAKEWFDKSAHSEIIDHFTGINLPFATYFLSVAMFNLSEMYKNKASDLVKETIQSLENYRLHPLNAIIQKSIERSNAEERDVGQMDNDVLQQTLNDFSSEFLNTQDLPTESQTKSQTESQTELPEIIGHVLDNGNIVDGDGREITVQEYVEKVTPRKSAKKFVETWNDDSDDKTNEVVRNLLYEPVIAEADSTSEEQTTTTEVPEAKVMVELPKTTVFKADRSRFECPVVGCVKRLKHKKNLDRHIATFHGKKRFDGVVTIQRVFCLNCRPPKEHLNFDNFKIHHHDFHDDSEQKFVIKEKKMNNLVFKTE